MAAKLMFLSHLLSYSYGKLLTFCKLAYKFGFFSCLFNAFIVNLPC